MACVTIAVTLLGILFNVIILLAKICKPCQENRKTKKESIEEHQQRLNKYNFEKDTSIDRTRVEKSLIINN
jgi:hypothetical protein